LFLRISTKFMKYINKNILNVGHLVTRRILFVFNLTTNHEVFHVIILLIFEFDVITTRRAKFIIVLLVIVTNTLIVTTLNLIFMCQLRSTERFVFATPIKVAIRVSGNNSYNLLANAIFLRTSHCCIKVIVVICTHNRFSNSGIYIFLQHDIIFI